MDAGTRRQCARRFTPTCVGTANVVRGNTGAGCAGSPPRAWGRRAGCRRLSEPRRCSVHPHVRGDGRHVLRRRCAECTAVHPHVRGDGFGPSTSDKSSACNGSPPRAWGRPPDQGRVKCLGSHIGSPPRAWGRRLPAKDEDMRGRRRFTPTCVGTASPVHLAMVRRSCTPVHPHVRGDGGIPIVSGPIIDGYVGSPPRAWGRPVGRGFRLKRLYRPVHPHVRGDGLASFRGVATCTFVGSPPRAWGRRVPGSLSVQHTAEFGSPPRAWGRLLKFGPPPSPPT